MFKQLSGMDSLFLYAENYRAPLEVGCLQIYDPSTAPQGIVRFKEILATFQSRLDRCDVFRRKLVTVPFSLDHPYWVLDEEFDLEYHVRHVSLPKPGDWSQLMSQVARLHARQLDHSRPLWMANIIEGLDNIAGLPPGSFAMYMKFHHAGIDGVTGHEVQEVMHDFAPYQADASTYAPSLGQRHDNEPSAWSLLARAPLSTAINATKLGFSMACAAQGILRAGLSPGDFRPPSVPMTVFNSTRVSPNRVIDGRYFDLDEFRKICKAYEGTTVNDVALTVVAGALRYYLEAREALPGDPLIALCPINVGTEYDAQQGRANLLSVMTPPLYTDIADPVERLRAIHTGTRDAKALAQKLGKTTLTRIPMNLPAIVAKNLYPLLQILALRSQMMPFNTIITNVALSDAPLYFCGARLVKVLATGPIIDQAGIFHTIFSFDGEVSIAFTACREMLPDPVFYAECIEASYKDLKHATISAPRTTKKKKKKKARKKTRAAKKVVTPPVYPAPSEATH